MNARSILFVSALLTLGMGTHAAVANHTIYIDDPDANVTVNDPITVKGRILRSLNAAEVASVTIKLIQNEITSDSKGSDRPHRMTPH